nr:cysteine-rich receptor-like protein kinase 2 [Tanacetum cinerariifolium]
MEKISTQMGTSNSGTAVTGIGPDRTYVLAECYGDLSTDDCHVCITEARGNLATCLPFNGGQVFLDGCFLRTQNYNFYQEYKGSMDAVLCGNTSMGHAFGDSVRLALSDVVRVAPRNKRFFARDMILSDIANESVYVLADCWNTLNESSCAECLNSAFESMVKCFPWSEGRALHSGCIIRYSNTNFLNPEPKKGNKRGKRMVIAVAVSFFLAFFILSFITMYAWKRRGSNDTKLLKMLKCSSMNFKYSTIEKATRYFDESNKLGEGGFGTVYKGVLPCGKEIAVKRLFFNHRHRAGDFYNEVNIISSVDHKNLVKLVGFSCLGPESILIYEYLPNLSLNHFIFDAVRGKELNWAKRYDIILGIAEGLAYLHENTKTRIIHRDIKAANILLDSRFRAKIADFGLARSYQQDKNHISTGIAGTLGYMAPEYITHGKLTEKVDVFSFGVLLLEVVSGMPNRGKETSEDAYGLVSIVWKHFTQGLVAQIYDPNLMLHTHTDDIVKKEIQSAVHIGLLCTQEVASLRPTMSMALQMLSKNIEPLPSPATPPYVTETCIQLVVGVRRHGELQLGWSVGYDGGQPKMVVVVCGWWLSAAVVSGFLLWRLLAVVVVADRGFFEKQKLTGPNFIDWYRQLRIVLSIEDKLNYLEQPIPPTLVALAGQHVAPEILGAHTAWIKGSKEIDGLMLMNMKPKIQRNLENLHAHEMLLELKTLFAQQAEQELLQTTRDFHSCKQEEGQSVSSYVLKMKGYIDNLERLRHAVTLGLGTINELHAMLKLHEQTLPKNNAPALQAIRAGKVQKVNKHKKSQPQMAARGQSNGKGKNKLAYAPKPNIPPPPKREDPAKDSVCHECGETGHWKRNCPQYLAELLKKKKNAASGAGGSDFFVIELNTILNRSWIYDTGCGTHICNTTQGLRASRKLKLGALSLYVGNGQREAVKAIGVFNLCLPSGLEIVLNNCHYASSITRG